METLSKDTNSIINHVFGEDLPLISESYNQSTFVNSHAEYNYGLINIIIYRDRGELFIDIGKTGSKKSFYIGTVFEYLGIKFDNTIPDIKHIELQLELIKSNSSALQPLFNEENIEMKLDNLQEAISNRLLNEISNKHEV